MVQPIHAISGGNDAGDGAGIEFQVAAEIRTPFWGDCH